MTYLTDTAAYQRMLKVPRLSNLAEMLAGRHHWSMSITSHRAAARLCLAAALACPLLLGAQGVGPTDSSLTVITADRVFDGVAMHTGWSVVVRGSRILSAGPTASVSIPATARRVSLPGMTLTPGLIEMHSHLLLHPYDETPWDDQVLREPLALRVARATNHARATLMAGFTTVRDLGTEGAGYADVGLKRAIAQGIIPGPRMFVTTRAIVATGSYGPHYTGDVELPQGAEEADGASLPRVVRDQIGHGADWIKVYADYRWGPNGEARPTFTESELRQIVEIASSSGRPVVVHASTAEGMRRAIAAGVETIEHGDGGTREVFRAMATAGIALCPTIAAGDAISQYRGWSPGMPEPPRIVEKRASMRLAIAEGVTICNGSDVGVFSPGENGRELELLVAYGLSPLQALTAATSVNARLLHMAGQLGVVKAGAIADLVGMVGDPVSDIGAVRKVEVVMPGGRVVRER